MPELRRSLGTTDAALITIGGVVGTGIFFTTGDIARELPHAGLIMLVWLAGGLLSLAGALTYARLAVAFPRAGGLYHYLNEAWGPPWGFLYGWASFFVIMSGGIAAMAVAGGETLHGLVPWMDARATAVGAIVFFTAINALGVKSGARTQNALTIVKLALIVGLAGFGLSAKSDVAIDLGAPLPDVPLLSAFGVGMIAALWACDGWYGTTFTAGEMRNPLVSLPRGLTIGTLVVLVLYLLVNLAYLHALPLGELAESRRVAEDAGMALFGAGAGRWLGITVLLSALGCLSCTILYSSRIYLPMAQDGVFFRAAAYIHPTTGAPSVSLWMQSAWAVVLALTGSYEQIYTYVVCAIVLFHVATALAVFKLRLARNPVVPAAFLLACLLLLINALVEKPVEALVGLGIVLTGLPAYAWWRRRA